MSGQRMCANAQCARYQEPTGLMGGLRLRDGSRTAWLERHREFQAALSREASS
jgi:hypothetical protein